MNLSVLLLVFLALQPKSVAISSSSSFNQRSYVIDGIPKLLLSGSVHYTRVPKSDWNAIFKMAKELGLNCIQTLVIWNQHEPIQGEIDWNISTSSDLIGFLELAASNGLYVNLRIGPYICGEYYFGGLPLWLRNLDNIQCFRCSDPIWKREMERWVGIVVAKVRHLFITNGGPIITMQIENEYFQYDDYAVWAVDMARNLTSEIPWEICHSVPECGQINAQQDKVLCSINGFWMDQGGAAGQPGPDFFQKLWKDNPNQPAIWTEDQGWFDKWGYGQRVRWTSDQLYGMARFFAYGGSYHNFYMLTGGNNYERRAGGEVTTGYAPDTVIDNLFLRHEPRFSVYQQFFQVLRDYEAVLLEHPPAKPIPLHYYVDDDGSNTPTNAEAHEYGKLVFLSNFDDGKSGTFAYKGFPYYITNHTVVLIHVSSRSSRTSQGLVLFNTSSTMRSNITPTSVKEPTTISIRNWRYFEEAVGYGANRNPVLQESPEQLNITNNDSDYLWYTFRTTNQTINSSEDILEVRLYGWDGQYYMYVDGKLLVSSVAENITKNRVFQKDIPQTIRTTDRVLRREEARRDSQQRIDILSVAMGLYNGDVGPASTKGLIYVTIGNSTANVTYNEFTTQWLLRGEEVAVYTDSGSKHVDWKPVSLNAKEYEEASESSLVWFQGTFDIPQEYHSFAGKGQPNQTALVVNLRDGKLQKGVAYVNGFDIGRYWLRAGHCEGTCAPPHHGSHCYIHWKGCGKPTQSLYHIPFEVLRPRNNLLTFFEETRATNECSLDQVKIQVLHHHNHNHHPILV